MPRFRPSAPAAGLLLLSASVGSILAAEVLIRLAGIGPAAGPFTVTQREFETVPGMYGPGQEVLNRIKPALPHRVTINQLGLRGEELTLEKPLGEFRILFLGDSQTLGDFVNDEETLSVRVEEHLKGRCPGVRAVNAGLSGSTIVDEFQVLRRTLVLDPDLVVIQFVENDVDDLARPVWDVLAINRERKSSFLLSLLYPIVRETALWNLLLRFNARLTWPVPDEPGNPADAVRLAQESEMLRALYRSGLTEVRDTLAHLGIPLVMTSVPSHTSVLGSEIGELIPWIERVGAEMDIPFVSVVDTLRSLASRGVDLYLLPHDGHPNAKAYDVTARAMAPELQTWCSSQ